MSDRKWDPEGTKMQLLKAVGEMMAEKGHRGINATALGLRINRHRTAVKNHFGSVKGLLETYVRLADYWKPSLEKFMLPETASDREVKEMFIALMQTSFDLFSQNREMQGIILWQVTEESPLMYRTSVEREKAAAALLALTDRHFEGKGVNFRAVMCILLSAIYYPVWHARYNKSSVAGIDINKEQDYKALRETIGYLIELVWGAK
ncbi:AcrR family transcriptional regulator [Pedobacter sp. AK017]|uniref:TetR/AcrR family transcriptional regulator n=1 Tax=Pedobacter sp. AK017 TaxID=2723073 RepID=UPI00161C3F62|nr:TetR/AcrR family transcriptional regulator [Pedobacter sp. AK017]MBB5440249.1 AcrR family transcriptional regulator [Pedobacter sp. AK017]